MTPEAIEATDAVMDTYKAMSPLEQAAVDELAEILELRIKNRNKANPALIVKPFLSKAMAIEVIGLVGIYILNGRGPVAQAMLEIGPVISAHKAAR